MKDVFRKFARVVAEWTGSATAFLVALLLVLVWSLTGPLFNFSENWQLVINTGTTIITFLMVFLIQNSQNRDSQMIHLKLDELIHASKNARNMMIDLDGRSDEELRQLHSQLCELKQQADRRLKKVVERQEEKQAKKRRS